MVILISQEATAVILLFGAQQLGGLQLSDLTRINRPCNHMRKSGFYQRFIGIIHPDVRKQLIAAIKHADFIIEPNIIQRGAIFEIEEHELDSRAEIE